MTTYLSSIAAVFGESLPASALVGGDVARQDVLLLQALGFARFYRAMEAGTLMRRACARSLELARAQPPGVTDLILTSNTVPLPALMGLAEDLGPRGCLAHVAVEVLPADGCADAIRAVLRAQEICEADARRAVLVCSVDLIDPSPYPRLNPRFTIHSDYAVSCIVSRAPVGFRLGLGRYRELDDVDRRGSVRALVGDVLRSNEVQMESVHRLVGPNFNEGHLGVIEDYFQVTRERAYTANLAVHAHCLGGDPVINLGDFAAADPGGVLLLYALSIRSMGLLVVEKV
jgi:hypothetical protein